MTTQLAPTNPGNALASFHRRRLVTCPQCGKRRFATVVNAQYCTPRCKARAQYLRRKVREAARNGDAPKAG